MKFCQPHWGICRQAVEAYGMVGLVSATGEEATERMKKEIGQGGESDDTFDPLMSLYWHFTNDALRCGGLYLMNPDPSGKNAGHYCPLCEFEKHMRGFDSQKAVDNIAKQIAEYCRGRGLIPKLD